MSSSSSLFLIFASLLFYSYPHTVASPATINGQLDTYIIHVQPTDNLDGGLDSLEIYYRSFLPKITTTDVGSEESTTRLVYSYSEVFSGFAARLTEQEVTEMAEKKGFVRAYPNKIVPLLTTHTPTFLGLDSGSRGGSSFWNSTNFGEGVIIGLLDTGVTPDHPSFSDQGLSAPPSKWKGTCAFQSGCNNKIIGARSYVTTGSKTPLDEVGHGTHTASTSAGNTVPKVNAFGLGSFTLSGIAPKAHLAIYRVCDAAGCSLSSVLAGLDDAVKDGVDVLSLSLGGDSTPYADDPIAIGAFGASEKGIVVVCAGGNSGPALTSLSNDAPWILTVAASSVDRSFRAAVKLGDKSEFYGETLFQPANFTSGSLPLFYPGDEKSTCDNFDRLDVVGKIVVCSSFDLQAVRASRAVGVILSSGVEEGYSILPRYAPFPVIYVSAADATKIISYASSGNSTTVGVVFNGTVLGTSPAPIVAFFSSRGPSQQSPGILKPDITAPGLNIVAAWNSVVDSSESKYGYNIVSGTSMATPHVSGIAALLKNLHPDWSPAAIRSAIITTSDADDRDGNPIKDENHRAASFYLKGAGHVNPPNAAEPGLVYDLGVDDYVGFLCGLGLDDSSIGAITRRGSNASCSGVKNITQAELNYPSITVSVQSSPVTVSRTVTNVGAANAKYTIEVDAPNGVFVAVKPQTLQFSKVNEKLTFTVTVSSSAASSAEGNLKWISGEVVVRSPLVILIA